MSSAELMDFFINFFKGHPILSLFIISFLIVFLFSEGSVTKDQKIYEIHKRNQEEIDKMVDYHRRNSGQK